MLRPVLLLIVGLLCCVQTQAGRHRVLHDWGHSAGSRPDLHWGEKDVFHGDYSVDETQLGGHFFVYKVPSPHGKISKQEIPDGTKIVINDYEETPSTEQADDRPPNGFHW